MRALCGAIITAGALIGLGLTAIGFGIRFQRFERMPDNERQFNVFYASPSLMTCLVVCVAAVAIGLAIAFLGLAFHHHRRHREIHGEPAHTAEGRVPVGTSRVSV
jgi:hypothetical protein